ncbi:hypothetical protein JNB_15978 [Janibacter sp. HTCC2649]|uniref:hypothetical protein n=1 Tax=Janibacter sp. HTCC2649 TaxID=313589 RepID=UPI0000671A2F|nr:hypothetical protein [Janibacter sp. HTCC2649]EAP98478.1 hypothetical protein JNB_15978 [Janibacter sp. HTCC2649]
MIHIDPVASGAARRKTHVWPATPVWSATTASRGWWIVLLLWWAGWFLAQHHQGGASWHFFSDGARVLSDLDDGRHAGLHVYAEHPVLQIGPVALGTAWVLATLSDSNGVLAAQVLGAALGGVIVLLVRHMAHQLQASHPSAQRLNVDRQLLLAAACFVPVWSYVAVSSTHLDDVLALTMGMAALALVVSRHPVGAGFAVALAVDSKPWALPLAAVLLALPSLRDRTMALCVVALGVAAVWLPFFIADPQTIRAMHFTIANSPLSGLRALDVMSPRTPAWDRPLQTVLGAGLAIAAVLRGRTTGVLLVVMASRLALDPSTNHYYTAGLAVGALLWDVTGSRRRWPWWSLTVLLVLHGARWVPALNPVHGLALIAFALAAAVFVAVGKF